MTRAKLLMVGLAVGLLAIFAAPASAQDGPAITVDPPSVDAAGEATFMVTGTGFTQPALFVLPCTIPEGGPEAVGQDDCDLANLLPVTVADGGFGPVEVTFDIPAEGLVVVAADAGQIETAAAVITVGEAAADETTDDEATDDEATDDEATDDEATDDTAAAQDELPETGAESTLLAIIGVSVALAGAMVVGASRRLGRV
ncbi:MAG: LPXTG cell wall anchor domain-containing protein [Acidimicrobiia bacterium]|nr:LPXTG cell wall anchor domain-containing protein [Acidimicrobiia bacterium]